MNENNNTKLKRVIVKEELVALTGDLEQAIMLNQFIYWSQRIKDFDVFINEEKERRQKEGIENPNIDFQNGWIYKDMKEFKEEIMFTSSISTISRKLDKLVENKWISRRRNPKFKWDKTYQYRVNLIKIAVDLFNIGYILQDYKLNLTEVLNLSNLQNADTITQICKTPEYSILQNETSYLQNETSYLQNERAIPEITTETTTEVINNQSSKKDIDGLIELDLQVKEAGFKTYKELIKDIGLEKENFEYPSSAYINCIKKSIWEMYNFDDTRIKNKRIGRYDVIKVIQNINFDIVQSSIDIIIEISKTQKINHQVALMKTILFNEIFEFDAKIQSQFNYDFNDEPKDTKHNKFKEDINKTRFHNFEGRSSKYSSEELNKRVEEISKKKIQEYQKIDKSAIY